MMIYTFNRTTVECKYTQYFYPAQATTTFNRTTVECKLQLLEVIRL